MKKQSTRKLQRAYPECPGACLAIYGDIWLHEKCLAGTPPVVAPQVKP